MNYTFENLEKSKVKFTITIDADEFEAAVAEAYQKTKGKYKVEGFRPGHAPRKVIESNYGAGVFFDDALDIILPKYYDEVLQKEPAIELCGKPEADIVEFDPTKGLTFTVVQEKYPEVKLGKYTGLKIAKEKVEVSDEQVAAELSLAQDKQSRMIDCADDKVSENNDIVNIDFVGTVDGVAFEGGSGESYDLTLGSGTFIPGFEEQLIGFKKGDKTDVKVTFPADYGAEQLAGKEAVFACTVNSIKTKELPALDDEFAKDASDFDTLDEYKADIKKQLIADAEQSADDEAEKKLLDKIAEASEVEIPESLVENQIDDRIKEFEYRLMYQGMKMEDYLKMTGMEMQSMRDSLKENAQMTVKLQLVLEAIIKKENIAPTEEEIEAKIAELAEAAKKSAEDYKKEMHSRQYSYIVNNMLNDKLLAFLKSKNKIA